MDEAKQRPSNGWYTYLGFRQSPEVCACVGCQVPDAEVPALERSEGFDPNHLICYPSWLCCIN